MLALGSVLLSVTPLFAGDGPTRTPSDSQPTKIIVPELPRDRAPRLGDKGTLVAHRAIVLHVLDKDNALVQIDWYETVAPPPAIPIVHMESAWMVFPTEQMKERRAFKTD